MRRLHLPILPQPSDSTCGPTCLQAVYAYYGDELPLEQVIAEVVALDAGGTLAVLLGLHALRRGYKAKIYTYNLQVFDPSWFRPGAADLRARLAAQMAQKSEPKLRLASQAYLEYLDLGGKVAMHDLTRALLREHLKAGTPILTGLSSTWLYQSPREVDHPPHEDDIQGVPQGHFVVLCGYDKKRRSVAVADPLHSNPMSGSLAYDVDIDRLLSSILLGILTYDANLLLIEPKQPAKELHDVDTHRRR